MCSIEEAWAGQTFGGKQVVSQSVIHDKYMSLPDNSLDRNNEYSMVNTNAQPPRNLTKGINTQRSRVPQVPKIVKNTSDVDIMFSSSLPPLNNYGGLNPRPKYMEVYDNTNDNSITPMPIYSKSSFTDINNAFTVSDTVNSFMTHNGNYHGNDNSLLNEDNDNERKFTEIKEQNRNKRNSNNSNNASSNNASYRNANSNNANKNHFIDVQTMNNKLNSESSSYNDDTHNINSNHNISNISSTNDIQLQMMMHQIITKLDNLEQALHSHSSRNMYDISLYILIGMIIAFILNSVFRKL